MDNSNNPINNLDATLSPGTATVDPVQPVTVPPVDNVNVTNNTSDDVVTTPPQVTSVDTLADFAELPNNTETTPPAPGTTLPVPPTIESQQSVEMSTDMPVPPVSPFGVGEVTPPASTDTLPPLPPVQPTEQQATSAPQPSTPPVQKNNMMGAVVAVLGVFVVGGIAGAAYFTSQRINTTASVSPATPESQSRAFDPSEMPSTSNITPEDSENTEPMPKISVMPTPELFNDQVEMDCSGVPQTAPYGNKCRPYITTPMGTTIWDPEWKDE